MRSLSTLGIAQSARAASAPSQLVAPSPAREATLEWVRQRNAFLDYLFYDLGVISAADAAALAPRYAAEGSVLLVGPTADPSLAVWSNAETYLRQGPNEVGAIAVAGVGSSSLGAAAFARNVADAIGRPVISIVSGYGLSDLFAEAVGGFFWFGQLNSVRHAFEPIDEVLRPRRADGSQSAMSGAISAVESAVRLSLDVKTLVALLASGISCDLLIGHSKGNLVISEALFALRTADAARVDRLGRTTAIITMSARIAMPSQFSRVVDVIGAIDAFGEINSRPGIAPDVRVPGAWHHTNTDLPMHLPVTRIVKEISASLQSGQTYGGRSPVPDGIAPAGHQPLV